jgi:hypothetical protein
MALSHSPKIVTDGLVLCLDAANPKSYPGSGNTWFDLSGTGNNGSITGTPIGNGTTNFTGTNSFVTIPFNANSFTFDFEQTVMIVLRPTENDASRRNPYNQAYSGGGTWTHEPNGTISSYFGTTGNNGSTWQALSSAVVVQNEWAVMTSTRNTTANFVRWYKNGVLTSSVASNYTQGLTGTQNILIGAGYVSSYIGNIDYVAVYNRALSTQEVQQNFNAIRGRYGL